MDEADPSLSVDAVVIDGAGAASDPPLPGSRAPSPELVKLLWGSQAVIITYDVTRRSTFEAAITYVSLGRTLQQHDRPAGVHAPGLRAAPPQQRVCLRAAGRARSATSAPPAPLS